MDWKGREKNAGYGTDLERQRDKQRAENGTIGPTMVHSLVHGDGSHLDHIHYGAEGWTLDEI